jgi:DNA-binding response OmpR family regulator
VQHLSGERAATVLVADDDKVVRQIVTAKLSGLGHQVVAVEDGQAALERLHAGEIPDLLITDQLMPRMNGMELVRAVREDSALAGLPIIMLTSKGSERDVVQGLQAGVDDYVVKPFSLDELGARVHTVLWRARPRDR